MLTFDALRAANLDRVGQFKNGKGETAHGEADGSDWSLNDWFTALTGEVGELGNMLKKVRRRDYTFEEKRQEIVDEMADIVIYLDLLANRAGVDLEQAIIDKFNRKSIEVGATTRL